MSIHKEQITGLILAGGMGSRMGGVDKGLQELAGKPLVLHVLDRLQPQAGALMINANRHLEQYGQFGIPVCNDAIAGYVGPLAGIHAGLLQCRTDYLVSAPCDSPLLPCDLVRHLAAALDDQTAQAAVAVTGIAEQRKRHPVFMLIHASVLEDLSAYLAAGGRKVDGWLRSLRCKEVHFEDEAAFTNVNKLTDLSAMSEQFAQS